MTRRLFKLVLVCVVVLLIGVQELTAEDRVRSTVGTVTQGNGRQDNGWLIIKTPSIVRTEDAAEIALDPNLAIANYERIIELSADPAVRAEAMRRSAYLRLKRLQAATRQPPQSGELQRVIATYERLLEEIPDDPFNDRARYQLARAYQLAGREASAIAQLRKLGAIAPASELAVDATFRAAEMLYLRRRYAQASTEYARVLEIGEGSNFYPLAQYKYGWSLFQQARYPQAIAAFMAVLERELPATGPNRDVRFEQAAEAVGNEMAVESQRVIAQAFAAQGGSGALVDYLSGNDGARRFENLLFSALGRHYAGNQRYTEAARTYEDLLRLNPAHPAAPQIQARVITAYADGGFSDLVVQAKASYVERFGPDAAYWQDKTPTEQVQSKLRHHLDDIGRHYQARAQRRPPSQLQARQRDFRTAAQWYARRLAWFADDPDAVKVRFLYADALLDAGDARAAAKQYQGIADAGDDASTAAEAAFAAVQAYEQLLARQTNDPATDRESLLRESVEARLKLCERFPQHPQWALVMSGAASQRQELGDEAGAVALAEKLLAARPNLAAPLRVHALGIMAQARFSDGAYQDAEKTYVRILQHLPTDSPERRPTLERLAAAIYRQGEQAREQGDVRAAANAFRRVDTIDASPDMRAKAVYDAALAFSTLKDWPAVQQTLRGYSARFAAHKLAADADKQLAQAYALDEQPAMAAPVFQRVATNPDETRDVRSHAAWAAAEAFEQAGQLQSSLQAYQYYLRHFEPEVERSIQVREKLAQLAGGGHNAQGRRWLQSVADLDRAAAQSGSDDARMRVARAKLELGRLDAQRAADIGLSTPLNVSLSRRNGLTQPAVSNLTDAARAGYAKVSSAATYELAQVYANLALALLESQRPAGLAGLELEQYELLLEEQAYPFEEQAIQAHLTNIGHLEQGLWNRWLDASTRALAQIAPGQYGKRERREDRYEPLH
ncbi:MAG: hypothetical protein ACPGZP_09665 [Panacagrimonas sp.]